MPVGPNLATGALRTAERVAAETVQVFCGNPRGWAASAGDPRRDRQFADGCAEAGIRSFVHAPYLVNLGSPTPATYHRSVDAVAHTLRRAAGIGAEGVVVHTGSCVDEGYVDRALRQVRDGLLPLLDELTEGDPDLLLEPTAGQGRSLCAGVADLGGYLETLEWHPRVGVCLDTCHVFAAGAPLDSPGGAAATLDELEAVAGAGRLRLVHANDSKDVRGSGKDRHERVGAGYLGTAPFIEMLTHPATRAVPFLSETSGKTPVLADEVALLKSLR